MFVLLRLLLLVIATTFAVHPFLRCTGCRGQELTAVQYCEAVAEAYLALMTSTACIKSCSTEDCIATACLRFISSPLGVGGPDWCVHQVLFEQPSADSLNSSHVDHESWISD